MGFFSYLFGINQTPAKNVQHPLSKIELDQIIRLKELKSITVAEKKLIIEALGKARHGNGKISLKHIHEVLGRLEMAGRISEYDRAGAMRAITRHFEEKYGKQAV